MWEKATSKGLVSGAHSIAETSTPATTGSLPSSPGLMPYAFSISAILFEKVGYYIPAPNKNTQSFCLMA